ncbi:WecB/TagA/CpsF family glycosyltransferase [Rathayibacter sp. SD072]|uniref:WecB/TagA/CpsF family glycosyltransferase n=1 Tax=Rathayibacter sp. SD072 TaxID=2781731 RepID=UPI001A965EC2|nr:WecB/TagA/CpsF family glycosyltransferase [Rathayibacter sp. SD072]MBO0982868.1 WecB/TagA/CpsF family glycosyltransferase [Rathayibacter sp. SD072]
MTSYITGRLEWMPASITSLDQAADAVLELARGGRDELVVTPNTDHFVRWKHSEAFRRHYGRAALVVLDGAPLVWLARGYGHSDATRVTGIDLFTEVCRRAAVEGLALAIIGGREGVAARAADALRQRFPGIVIRLAEGPSSSDLDDPAYLAALAARLRAEGVQILALCLGSPKQEEVQAALLRAGGSGAVSLGVGAAVDFLAGTAVRAPMILQKLGLEWLHRLVSEPRRLGRRYATDAILIAPSLIALARFRIVRRHHRSPSSPGDRT